MFCVYILQHVDFTIHIEYIHRIYIHESSGCLPDITLKLSLSQGASPYDIAISAPRMAGVRELYPKDMPETQAIIGYCRVVAGNDRVSELYP